MIKLVRMLFIFVGFLGVIIILRPTTNVISEGAIYALVGAIMFAVYLILTRYVSRLDTAITSFFWTGIGGSVTMTIISFFIWEDILREDLLWLLIMCLLSASSHFMMVKTLQVAEASVIQPFSYLQLVFEEEGEALVPFDEIEQYIWAANDKKTLH